MNDIEEKALVVDMDNEFVFLMREGSSCSKCSSGGCGNLGSVFSVGIERRLKLENTLGLKKGDTVIISASSLSILSSVFLVYLLPLLFLFLFSFLAKVFVGEIFSIFLGLIGLLLGGVFVSLLLRNSKMFNNLKPKLIRKVINIQAI